MTLANALRRFLAPLWALHCRAAEAIPPRVLTALWLVPAALGFIGGFAEPSAPLGILCACAGLAFTWQWWRQATGRTIDPSTLRLPWRIKRG